MLGGGVTQTEAAEVAAAGRSRAVAVTSENSPPDAITGIAAQECTFIGVAPATDPALILPVWLAELDGSITDVAATGQCGWLAFWAALRNRDTGLSPPTEEVAQEANEIKKQVLNGMIANPVDEMELHPMDIIAERRASGKTSRKDVTKEELLCDPANHYATMRKRSVTATVPGNYWVRTAQLKGMTMYAREHLFVLDVMADGVARVQLYAYSEQVTKNGELVESGTVTTLSTEVELQIFRELKAHDILPLVLVLWW
ncbi:hypothetical protein PI125_g20436 [Phytophthora idaei]|nr:hypothetical protein PI125_g20436 [Phytophthora idaei]